MEKSVPETWRGDVLVLLFWKDGDSSPPPLCLSLIPFDIVELEPGWRDLCLEHRSHSLLSLVLAVWNGKPQLQSDGPDLVFCPQKYEKSSEVSAKNPALPSK